MTSGEPSSDLDALLAPIPGDRPTGADLRYTATYDKINAARRTADDKYYGRSAHSDSEDRLNADERVAAAREYWLAVQRLVTNALTTQSKDLQLAVWLLEVETYTSGFSGAARTLRLIRRLLEVYWDTIYPAIEDDDEPLALRVGVMEWIKDRLPAILEGLPLSAGSSSYSLVDYELAQRITDPKSRAELIEAGRPSLEQFLAAMSGSSEPHLETMAANVDECLTQVIQLEQTTDALFVEPSAPGAVERPSHLLSFGSVRKVLEDCQFQIGRALRAKAPREAGPKAPPTEPKPIGVTPGDVSLSPGDGIWDRAMQLVKQGQLEGLRLAQNHIAAAPSGRERFLRQLQLSELCLQAGMEAFAYPILDELGKTVDERDLVTWEDADVIRRTWSGLASVCKPMARLRPDSVAREAVAQQRLGALVSAEGHAES